MNKIINVFLFSFFILSSISFAAEKEIVIAVREEWENNLEVLKELLAESYNEIGYKVIFKSLPLARGLVELADGRVDGDIARLENITQEYDVVLVHPPYFTLRSYAYYEKNRFKKTPTVDDIKNGKVGYLSGAFAVEKFFINAKSPIKVNNQTQLINLLIHKRVDFIVPSALLQAKEKNLGKVLLFELSLHHILSTQNKELAKKLEPVLKKNMSKKKYDHLHDQIEKVVLENPNKT